eukprot:11063713-Ditylum_brightwellii.AAC.1
MQQNYKSSVSTPTPKYNIGRLNTPNAFVSFNITVSSATSMLIKASTNKPSTTPKNAPDMPSQTVIALLNIGLWLTNLNISARRQESFVPIKLPVAVVIEGSMVLMLCTL